MKSILLSIRLTFLFIFCLLTTDFAQNNFYGAEKFPGSDQVPDIPHLKFNNESLTQCRYAYYFNVTTSMLGRFSINGTCPGGNIAVWTPPTFASAGVRGGDGNFYILNAGLPGSLGKLDTSNGNVTILGQISGLDGTSANGIAYNHINDSYYICSNSGSTNYLYKIDINTLTASLVSTINSGSPMIAIAINSSGIGYGYDLMPNNKAYTFNPVTGIFTLLGPIGFNADFAQDLDIDNEGGTIYLIAFNASNNSGEFRTMDPNTGMTTLIFPLPGLVSVFAIDNGYEIVPVELTSFTFSLSNENIILNWTTSTETNNLGFEIDRLKKSKYQKSEEWEIIGFVNGIGTTTEPQSYSFADENVSTGKYQYRLKQIDLDGTFAYSNTIETEIEAPDEFSLEQNYPNPFNPSTSIKYAIGSRQFVQLKINDILGNEVATLVSEYRNPGSYQINFNASKLSSGVYYYQLKAGDYFQTKKMILIK